MPKDFADSFADALGSFTRIQTFQEELKRSRLERAEYEADAGHRQLMKQLAEQRGQSENSLLTLQNRQVEQSIGFADDEQPLKIKEREANIRQSDAATSSSGSSARYTDTLTRGADLKIKQDAHKHPYEVAQERIKAETGQTSLIAQQLSLAGAQGRSAATNREAVSFARDQQPKDYASLVKPEDIAATIKRTADSLGMPDNSPLRVSMLEQAMNEFQAQKQELMDHDLKNSEYRTSKSFETGIKVAELAMKMQDPTSAVAGIATAFGDDPVVIKIAEGMVKGQVLARTNEERQKQALDEAEFLSKTPELKDLQDEISRQTARLASIPETNSQYPKTKRTLETLQTRYDNIKAGLVNERRKMLGTTDKGTTAKQKITLEQIPLPVLRALTPNGMRKLADETGLDYDAIKAYQAEKFPPSR